MNTWLILLLLLPTVYGAADPKVSLKKPKSFFSLFTGFFKNRDTTYKDGPPQPEKVRKVCLEKEMAKYPNEPVVKAIALNKDDELVKELNKGLSSVDKFRIYVEFSTIVPNEFAGDLLIRELDPKQTHSKKLLSHLEEEDLLDIMGEFVKGHIRAIFFKRLFQLHPPKIEGGRFLTSVLDEMSLATGNVFIDYLHACKELAVLVKNFSINKVLAKYYQRIGKDGKKPTNITLGLLYLYVSSDSAGVAKGYALSILQRRPLRSDQIPEFLRGIDTILMVTDRLTRYAKIPRGNQAKIRELTKIVLRFDPDLDLVFSERLLSILEMLELVGRVDKTKSHHYKVLETRCQNLLYELSVPLLGFALRTQLVPIEKAKKGLGWVSNSYKSKSQAEMVKLMDLLLKIKPLRFEDEKAEEVTHIALGDGVSEKVFHNFQLEEKQAFIETVLAYLFDLPTPSFYSDVPMEHLEFIDQLNARLQLRDYKKAVVFHKNMMDGSRIWMTKDSSIKPTKHSKKPKGQRK